jgi:Ni/Co efflux regulator RcnB
MRKVLISILLASAVATPALARPDPSDREAARAERHEARSERQQSREETRSERPANTDRSQASRPERAERVERVERQVQAPPQSFDRHVRVEQSERPAIRDTDALRNARVQSRNDRIEKRQDRVEALRENRDLRQSVRPLPRVLHPRVPVVSETPRFGTQPPARVDNRSYARPNWSTNWRHNGKYDWKNHRRHHRSLFHFGFYYDPFGWGYQRYSIGWRLWPSYYSSSFWLNDPWMYRLPYAPPGTRWIRYYDDAILVDTWSGQVVDVIYDFFW